MSTSPAIKMPPGRRSAPPRDDRARLIRLVHVGRRELRLEDGAYRALLMAEGGADSSADMSTGQLQRVVDRMKRQGFKVTSKAPASTRKVVVKGRRTGVASAVEAGSASSVVLASDPESRKARAMWITLHEIGQVRDPSEAALLAYARRQTGAERLEWVADMVPVLEPLKAWLLRSMPQVVTPYLREPVVQWAGHMGQMWHDNWIQSVSKLQRGLARGLTQLVDEYVDLWALIKAAREGKQS